MKAARYYGATDIRIDHDAPEPIPGPRQLLVDVAWSGICGSDLHFWTIGPSPDRTLGLPSTLGHELCGTVRDPPVWSKFKHGDKVMVDPRICCRGCQACKDGTSAACSDLGYLGGTTEHGGFGERVVVKESELYLLPEKIPLEYAAIIEPLAVVQHAIKVSGVKEWKGKDVLVLGGGPIGFALLLVLKAAGADRVIVSEPAALRREQVKNLSRGVINPIEESVEKKCLELTDGRGAEVVFDCAGVPAGLESAFDAIRFNGLYVMIAVWEKPLEIPCMKFLAKHITMKGAYIFDDDSMGEVLDMMASGKLTGYEKMVTSHIGIDDIVDKGFKELIANKDSHIKILVSPT
ncbi:unnamed protein product [Zymoseptoria tritici ST99CH_3D1]|nr:unnamed protein product [Zymoseptoria tritici ST99CH_3D1]